MRIIGDIHGKVHQYADLLEGVSDSIQVGDFGMGFLTPNQHETVDEVHASGNHRFIRGNHDDPARCKASPGWIQDGSYDAESQTMFVGGAWSIDVIERKYRDQRNGTTSWWPDEELTIEELQQIHYDFARLKPEIMITHDCPMQAAKYMFFDNPMFRAFGPQQPTRTAVALQDMFYDHQPKLWVFGHWHFDHTMQIEGTQFLCLNELSYVDL